MLNLNTVDSLGTTRSHVALDPLFGGRLSFEEQRSYFVTGAETDRTLDADTATNDDLADVLGTLIGDLRDRGIVE